MPSPELREFIETGIRVLQILRDEMTPKEESFARFHDDNDSGATYEPLLKPNGSPPVAEPSVEQVEALFDETPTVPAPAATEDASPVPQPKKKGRPFSKRTIGAEAQKAINETVKTAASKEKDPEELRDDIVKKCGKHYVGGDKAKKDLIDKFKKTHKLEYMRDMEDEVLPLAQQMLAQLDALDGV